MKKLLKLNIIFLLTIMLLGIPNVFATEPDPGDTPTNPSTGTIEPYSYNGYKYWISGFKLNVYKIDNSKTKTNTTTGEGSTITVDSNEDLDKYLNDVPTSTKNLPYLQALEPTYKEDKLGKNDALYIDLNYNLTKQQLQDLLATEIDSVTDEIGYLVEIVVEYNFIEIPEGLNYHYKVNFTKSLMSTFFATENAVSIDPRINMLEANEQVIGLIDIFKDEDNDEVSFDYNQTLDGSGNYGILNYQVLSKTELTEATEDLADYVIMFHNVDDIDTLIEVMRDTSNIDEEEASDIIEDTIGNITDTSKQEEVAKVENTAATYPLYIYVLSVIGILVGVLVIVSTRLQSKQKQIEQ